MICSKKIYASILSLAFVMACSSEKKQAVQEEEVQKPSVRVEQVKLRDVAQIREFTATVQAFVSNNIAPQSPARIENIFVEIGDRVRKGQKLVQMDNSTLIKQKAQLENLRTEFERVDELYKIGGVSRSAWEAQKTNLDVAEASFKNLAVNTQLVSPINGIVTARNYDSGDMYGQQPILTVEQIAPVKLLINVSEAYFRYVKKGMPVDIQLDVYGDEPFEGNVSLVYPTIDPSTRTFTVEITIKNENQRVRPGMFARATLNFGTVQNIVVPDMAVIKLAGSGDRFVFVVNDDNTVEYRQVTLGQRVQDAYELLSGVNDEERVVVAGQNRLKNGIEVEILK